MNKIISIYKIQSRCKPKRLYIGSSINVKKRWNHHIADLRNGVHHSRKLQRHFNKYGESDLVFSILLGCDKNNILSMEQFFLDSLKPYFNCCPVAGTCAALKRSRETIEKQRKSMRGKKWSLEARKRFSEKLKGKKVISEEARRKISKTLTGRKGNPCSEEKKQKFSIERRGKNNPMYGKRAWNKGVPMSEEIKMVLIKANKGRAPWNKGRKMTEEEKLRLTELRKKKARERA